MRIYVHIGALPNSICLLSSLQYFYTSSNPGILCAPLCVSSVTSRTVPTAVCVYPQDIAICGLLAATNLQSVIGLSCSVTGYTTTTPCLSPVLSEFSCIGMDLVHLELGSKTLIGNSITF